MSNPENRGAIDKSLAREMAALLKSKRKKIGEAEEGASGANFSQVDSYSKLQQIQFGNKGNDFDNIELLSESNTDKIDDKIKGGVVYGKDGRLTKS